MFYSDKIKILFIVDYSTPIYTGLLSSYKKSFDKLNIKNEVFSFNINNQFLRVAKYNNFLLKSLVKKQQDILISYIEKKSFSHIIVIKGSFLLAETIDYIKSKGIIISNINPDNPFNTQSLISSNYIIRETIKNYDFYFIWSKAIKNQISTIYPKLKVIYLPFAVDQSLIPTFNSNKIHYNYHISFIANADNERKKVISRLLKDNFIYKNLNLFGDGWNNINSINNPIKLIDINYFETIHQSKININILRLQNKNSHNMRTFEIPACAGFMLHEYSEEADEFFKSGIEAEYFKTIEECIDKCHFYLKNENVRQKILMNGYEKTKQKSYSYLHRAETVLKSITS
ncbi:MAG: glycosyltransferase [Bacteroidia bacterium]